MTVVNQNIFELQPENLNSNVIYTVFDSDFRSDSYYRYISYILYGIKISSDGIRMYRWSWSDHPYSWEADCFNFYHTDDTKEIGEYFPDQVMEWLL